MVEVKEEKGTAMETLCSLAMFCFRRVVVYSLTCVRKKACTQLCEVHVRPTYVHTRSQMLRARSHSRNVARTLCELFANFSCTVPYDREKLVTWEMVEGKVEKWFWVHYQFTNQWRCVQKSCWLFVQPKTDSRWIAFIQALYTLRQKCVIVYAKQPLGFNKPLPLSNDFLSLTCL